MQKQGFYSAHRCCCTNARLLGIYPGHQFGKLELKKKQYWNWNFYWNWKNHIGIGILIGIPIGIGNPIENPIEIGIPIGNPIVFLLELNWIQRWAFLVESLFLLECLLNRESYSKSNCNWNSYWKSYLDSFWNWIELKDGHDTYLNKVLDPNWNPEPWNTEPPS